MSSIQETVPEIKNTQLKSKKVLKRSVKPVEEVVVEDVLVVEEPVVEEAVVVVEASFNEEMDIFNHSLEQMSKSLKNLFIEGKRLRKKHDAELKSKKRRVKKSPSENSPPRKLTGFAAPCKISTDLHDFLEPYGVGRDDEISGTKVSSYVSKYIKEHVLANPEFPKEFLPNETLRRLLSESTTRRVPTDESSVFVYRTFGVQAYLRHHFNRQ